MTPMSFTNSPIDRHFRRDRTIDSTASCTPLKHVVGEGGKFA